MRRWPVLGLVFALAACGWSWLPFSSSKNVAEFWRPISEPNIEMPLARAQKKLDFDLSQCRCGIFPANVAQADLSSFQLDKQRLSETGVTVTPNDNGDCVEQPSLVVSECMRGRGWEVTNCSGRMPVPGGGSLCTAYVTPSDQ